jgi:hypothetical protein
LHRIIRDVFIWTDFLFKICVNLVRAITESQTGLELLNIEFWDI